MQTPHRETSAGRQCANFLPKGNQAKQLHSFFLSDPMEAPTSEQVYIY